MMTPFQEFRLWARRAPTGHRASAAVVALVVLGLLIWAIVPSGGSSDTTASGATSNVATNVAATPPSPAPARSGCVAPSGTVPGVTDTTIKLGVIIVSLSGIASNSQFGILPVSEQKSNFSKVIASVNSEGGVDCRQIVPQFFTANPADQSDLQKVCLDAAQAGVFAVVDAGAYAQFTIVDCFPQHHIPYFGGYLLPNSQMAKFYPYLFELNSYDTVYHDTIGGLAQRGWFKPENGFKKLGLIYHSCYPEIHTEVVKWLAAAGVTSAQTVAVDLGCPNGFANSVDLQHAVLKFKHAGVTNMIPINMVGDLTVFTSLAQAQGFKPNYGFPDDSLITTSYGTQHPSYENIDGALAVTASAEGEERTAGTTRSPGTLKCNSITGRDMWKEPAAAGNGCDQVWMFAAAVDHATTLSQSALAAGLHAARAVEFSFPQGPNDFGAGSQVTYAGQYWRVTQFHLSCSCWQLVDKTYHPSVQ